MISKVYRLYREQTLPISKAEAWDFFSTPRNLEELTPTEIGFKILTCSHEKMVEGQIISYKVKVFPLIWIHWVTEITYVQEGEYFIDDQRSGPYAMWHHRHTFKEVDEGVLMEDEVHYAMPFGFLGQIMHKLFIGKKLQRIFDYRIEMLEEKFGK